MHALRVYFDNKQLQPVSTEPRQNHTRNALAAAVTCEPRACYVSNWTPAEVTPQQRQGSRASGARCQHVGQRAANNSRKQPRSRTEQSQTAETPGSWARNDGGCRGSVGTGARAMQTVSQNVSSPPARAREDCTRPTLATESSPRARFREYPRCARNYPQVSGQRPKKEAPAVSGADQVTRERNKQQNASFTEQTQEKAHASSNTQIA